MGKKATSVMSSVSNSFKFTSDKVKNNLVEYVRRENININENDLRKLLTVVESSIDQSFVLTSDSIQKSLTGVLKHSNDRK